MRHWISAVILALMPVSAQAGDPCPIPVNIRDLGVPDWLDRDDLLAQLEVQKSWIGMSFDYTETGLHLTYIHADSTADQAGLMVGEHVTAINGVPMTDALRSDAMFDALTPGAPITFTLLGKPDVSARVGYTDPVPFGVFQALEQQDCRTGDIRRVPLPKRANILPMLFHENRAFRCEDAHIALEALGERFEIAEVYFVRGSRRILIAMPYWGTRCINVTALDGANYTEQHLLDAVNPVIKDYVQDRFDNP